MHCSSVSSHTGLRSCQKTAPARALHRLKLPSGHAHLLRCGVLHGVQLHVCSTVSSISCRVMPMVISVAHRRLSEPSASPPPPCFPSSCPAPHVCRALSPPFSLTSHSCRVLVLALSQTLSQRCHQSLCLAQLCLGPFCSWLGHRCSSSFFLTEPTPAPSPTINTLSVNLTHQVHLRNYYDLVIKIFRAMPLPKLRCKGDHVPASIVWILFNSNCEVERKTDRKK